MSQTTSHGTETNASLVWQQLSERVDALVAAWEGANEPPLLAQFLPAESPELRRLTLVEAIKIDLEYRWQDRRFPKKLEAYLDEFPELVAGGGVPCDIIYEEYHIRKQRGDAVTVQEYWERFPDRTEELRRLFQLESPETSTALLPAERVPTYQVGQQVDDFDLLNLLGKGAFATVFLARQRSMQRLVALKISRDRGFEHQTLAQLEHQHIVRVFDQRQLPDQKMRLLYMQYVPGGTLQGVIEYARQVPSTVRRGATLLEAIDRALAEKNENPPTDSMTRHKLRSASWSEVVCWIGARLAQALDYAHGRGVLHRDVKPANVLVGADGQPRLADFNISFSKLDGATPAAYFGGSLAYMSPEQLEAFNPAHDRSPEELDGRSDIYSLGILLWELLTGKRPFAEETLPKSWSQVVPEMTATRRAGVPRAAREGAAVDAPARVIDVLLKCLQPAAEDRYASAGELARELDLCLQPRAHALLHSPRSWASVLRRHPVATTLSLGVLPNVALCVLNVTYNVKEIVSNLSATEKHVFLTQVLVVNAIAYAIGLGYVCLSRAKVFGVLRRLARGEKLAQPPARQLVRRCLTLGYATAVVTAILWTLSGFIFPGWMLYGAGPDSKLTTEHFAHFIASNLLCGMIAATQSYYLVTFLSVRFSFPWLLKARVGVARDVDDMADLARRGRAFLVFTFSVPFLAVLTLSAIPRLDSGSAVFGALGVLGLVGSMLAYLFELAIRGDVAALAATMNPGGDTLLGGDSFESALAGSRR